MAVSEQCSKISIPSEETVKCTCMVGQKCLECIKSMLLAEIRATTCEFRTLGQKLCMLEERAMELFRRPQDYSDYNEQMVARIRAAER